MTVFVTHPISATFLGLTALLVVVPLVIRRYRKRKGAVAAATAS